MNKIAVFVAAGSGMGADAAKKLFKDGYKIAIMSSSGKGEKLGKKLKGIGFTGSNTNKKDLKKFFELVIKKYGRIDVLVNSAGHGPKGDILKISDEEWHKSMEIYFLNVVRAARLVTPIMKKQKKGSIINISTYAIFEPEKSFPTSGIIRSGLAAFTKIYSDEYAKFGIRMNNILPGFINSLDPKKEFIKRVPLKRIGKVNEVSSVISLLASEDGGYITGQNIRVDGGITRSVWEMIKKNITLLGKKFNLPISCLTAYSASVAKILDGYVDIILIGDSLGSTLYGMSNTQGVTLEMMKLHGKAVVDNAKKSMTMIDMPYKTYKNKSDALKNAKKLIQYTNANLIKIEINVKKLNIVEHLSKKNINVVAHIGVTPQSYSDFKKIKILGRIEKERNNLVKLALNAENAGAKAILLECITEKTAKEITSVTKLPTIGIGASKHCDGQVLVFDDLINLNSNNKTPKFVKKYIDFNKISRRAVRNFDHDVKKGKFPNRKNTY